MIFFSKFKKIWPFFLKRREKTIMAEQEWCADERIRDGVQNSRDRCCSCDDNKDKGSLYY